MVLLAGFSALMSRLASQNDVVVGTPAGGRRLPELEPLIGLFVNLLPVRLTHGARPTGHQLVAATRDAALAALDHQDLPFERILQSIEIERSLEHEPLIQAVFQAGELDDDETERAATSPWQAAGAAVANVRFELEAAAAISPDGGVRIDWRYRADLFDAVTVGRWADALERVLAGMAAAPESAVADLPLLGDDHRRQVLETWAAGPARPASAEPISARVRRRATASPDAAAVVAADGTCLRFGDLVGRPRPWRAVSTPPACSRRTSSPCCSIAPPSWRSAPSPCSTRAPPTCPSTRTIQSSA